MPGRKKRVLTPEEEAQKKKIRELEDRMNNPSDLSHDEYVSLLRTTRKNYLLLLAIASVERKTKATGSYIHLIEKTHYLLESTEGKPTHRVDVTHNVGEKTRAEFRDMLKDPNNLHKILEVEGIVLEGLTTDASQN